MITVKCDWTFERSESFLKRLLKLDIREILESCAREGVEELKRNTPKDSGNTADCWDYEIEYGREKQTIWFTNSNVNNGVPIAIILQYGHGTRNGGYVQGIDYINPSLERVFKRLADDAWKEVTKV